MILRFLLASSLAFSADWAGFRGTQRIGRGHGGQSPRAEANPPGYSHPMEYTESHCCPRQDNRGVADIEGMLCKAGLYVEFYQPSCWRKWRL